MCVCGEGWESDESVSSRGSRMEPCQKTNVKRTTHRKTLALSVSYFGSSELRFDTSSLLTLTWQIRIILLAHQIKKPQRKYVIFLSCGVVEYWDRKSILGADTESYVEID